WRQALEPRRQDLDKKGARVFEAIGGDRAVSLVLPRLIERLERFVQESSALERRQPLLVFVLFGQAEHVPREELEWTLTVLIDRADRPGTGVARVNRPVELRLGL